MVTRAGSHTVERMVHNSRIASRAELSEKTTQRISVRNDWNRRFSANGSSENIVHDVEG